MNMMTIHKGPLCAWARSFPPEADRRFAQDDRLVMRAVLQRVTRASVTIDGETVTGRVDTTAALLVFIVAMGIVGAVTAKGTILVLQSLPAGIGLALLYLT